MDAEKESFELAKLALIQYFYIQGEGGPIIIGQLKSESFLIYSLMLIDQIETNMAHDRLLLCVYGYDIRSGMKPSLVGEIFIVLKI